MASKVNTRFVVILVCGLLILFGSVAVLAARMLTQGGERYIKKGDEALAAGDVKQAAAFYERAVGKKGGQTNEAWLIKWRDALVQTTPATQLDYGKAYQFYVRILDQLAKIAPTDPQKQLDYIKERTAQIRVDGTAREEAEFLIEEVNGCLEDLDPENPLTKKLLGYRGGAQLERMRVTNTVTEEEREQALKDVTIAAEADPTNWEANINVASYWYILSQQASVSGRKNESKEFAQKGREALEKYIASNPKQPEARVMLFNVKRSELFNEMNTMEERRKAVRPLIEEATEIFDIMLEADPTTMRPTLLYAARGSVLIDESLNDKYVKVLERTLEAQPNEPELMLGYGEAKEMVGDVEEGIALYQKVVELPDRPVSLAGVVLPMYRRVAVGKQIDSMMQLLNTTGDEEQRKVVLERAKKYRDKLATMVDVNTENELKLRDGVLAVAEGRYDAAVALLSDLRSGGQSENSRVLLPLAEALRRQGNIGEAKRIYDKLYEQGITDVSLLLRLGDLYLVSMQDPARARVYYQAALAQDANNEAAKQQLARITAIEKGGEDGVLPEDAAKADPVLAVIVEAAGLQSKGEGEKASKMLADAMVKNPGDQRLLRAAIQVMMSDGRRDEALALVREERKKRPDDKDLENTETYLATEDPKEAALKVLESADATPLQKALGRYQINAKFNDVAGAKAAFAEAEKLGPDEPAVVESGFLLALAEREFDRARGYATRAGEKNIDQLNGLSFQGRLELAQGKSRDAAATFRKAVDKIPERPESWRWLAQAQTMNGDITNAVESYARALAGRPSDVSIAKEYARTLYAVGQQKEALKVARDVMKFGGDQDLYAMWLELEGTVGDTKVAIEKREITLKGEPSNLPNAAALARLYISQARYPDAGRVIETIAKQKDVDPLQAASLRAELAAAEGKIIDGAKQYADLIAATPEKDRTINMYSAYARYQMKHEQFQDAATTLAEARAYQSKERMEADRQLGDLLFDRGIKGMAASAEVRMTGDTTQADIFEQRAREFLEQSREAYQRVIDAGADQGTDGHAVSKRVAEAYARLDQYDKADAAIQAMIDRVPADQRDAMAKDREVMLLRAQFAIGAKDRRRAREILDKACELYPTEPSPFLRRAILSESEPGDSMFADAIADLDKVNTLRPGMIEAWQLRCEMYRKRNRMDEAYVELRKGIQANPNDNGLKMFLVEMMTREGKSEEAAAELVRFARERPEDMEWAKLAAERCSKQQMWVLGDELWSKLYYQEREPKDRDYMYAARLLECKLRRSDKKPDKRDVVALLYWVKEIPEQDRWLYMLRARGNVYLEELAKGAEFAIQSYEKCEGNTEALTRWFNELASIQGPEGFGEGVLASIEKKGALPPIVQIARFGNKFAKATGEVQLAELAKLDKLTPSTDRLARLELCRLGQRVMYVQRKFPEAVKYAEEGIKIFPDDRELNNNVAYLLVKNMDKPAEALPYAKRATELDPRNSSSLDTLGVVYLRLDQLSDAEQVLSRAVATAKLAEEVLTANLHYGQTLLKRGDKDGAKRAYNQASSGFGQCDKETQDLYKAELESLGNDVK